MSEDKHLTVVIPYNSDRDVSIQDGDKMTVANGIGETEIRFAVTRAMEERMKDRSSKQAFSRAEYDEFGRCIGFGTTRSDENQTIDQVVLAMVADLVAAQSEWTLMMFPTYYKPLTARTSFVTDPPECVAEPIGGDELARRIPAYNLPIGGTHLFTAPANEPFPRIEFAPTGFTKFLSPATAAPVRYVLNGQNGPDFKELSDGTWGNIVPECTEPKLQMNRREQIRHVAKRLVENGKFIDLVVAELSNLLETL